MESNQRGASEAAAGSRVAEAARTVQAGSAALENHFHDQKDVAAPTLLLARLTAAMLELQAARDEFDALVRAAGSTGSGATGNWTDAQRVR
ncbi:hypothetical protein CBA19CS22_12285 [Caballeronia novacaledonica]|uniref:Uncharacterized protein n=1 Tax=Caballeronia novacaledonica TaxID=1544861 RepID=A0ACB5QQX2_9BURK|nr:hypothetical protein CBA19CS22_12285 [Caballeronia novacaledonica]